jgi:hypothetical protein
MTREETSKLTKAEMKARRLAQTRACRHRQKLADHLADVARHDASAALSLVFVETSGKFLLTISHHILELAGRDAPQLDGSSALVSMCRVVLNKRTLTAGEVAGSTPAGALDPI